MYVYMYVFVEYVCFHVFTNISMSIYFCTIPHLATNNLLSPLVVSKRLL